MKVSVKTMCRDNGCTLKSVTICRACVTDTPTATSLAAHPRGQFTGLRAGVSPS